MCVFMIVLVETTLLASSWNLVTLTLNRYIAVTNPTLCKKLFSWKRSLCGALLIWALSLILNCLFYIEPQPGIVNYAHFELVLRKSSQQLKTPEKYL